MLATLDIDHLGNLDDMELLIAIKPINQLGRFSSGLDLLRLPRTATKRTIPILTTATAIVSLPVRHRVERLPSLFVEEWLAPASPDTEDWADDTSLLEMFTTSWWSSDLVAVDGRMLRIDSVATTSMKLRMICELTRFSDTDDVGCMSPYPTVAAVTMLK